MAESVLKEVKRGSTERIRRLREISTKKSKPSISMERAVLLTEAYKKYEGKFSTPVLRGLAFKYIMENRTLYIEKGAIILGEKRTQAVGCTNFPGIMLSYYGRF